MNNKDKLTKIILTGLMMAMTVVATMLIPIPIPFSTGYVHMGDAMIFLSVLILGWKYGGAAAGMGSALADLFVGYAVWAPWTLVVKGIMAIIMGLFIQKSMQKKGFKIIGVPVYQLLGMIFGGIFMVAGYYVAEGFIYGNFVSPILGVPWNILQFSVGTFVATLLAAAIYKTPIARYFEYRPAKEISNDENKGHEVL